MIKLTYCLRRRGDLSPTAFREYWLEKHGPLVGRFAKALRVRRYVQSHTLDSDLNAALRASRNAGEPFDGVAEVWWESAEDLREALATAEGQRAGLELLRDERNFVDFAGSSLFVTEEHAILGP